MDFHIQKAKNNLLPDLLAFARASFIATYAHRNSPENMAHYLDENFTGEAFREEFDHPDSEFFIALLKDEIIGYFKVNFGAAQTEPDHPNSCEVERIYVSTAYQGKGIGRLLFDAVVKYARTRKSNYLWLGVWEHNTEAIAFYKKMGMWKFGEHLFHLGNEAQTDFLLRYDL